MLSSSTTPRIFFTGIRNLAGIAITLFFVCACSPAEESAPVSTLKPAGTSTTVTSTNAAMVGPTIDRPAQTADAAAPAASTDSNPAVLPKLVDLGSKNCIPCKKMAPILDELTKDYSDHFTVEFIDVWLPENTSHAEKYGIKTIPTQIFLDPNGKELDRHVGFMSKEDILARWKKLGYDMQ